MYDTSTTYGTTWSHMLATSDVTYANNSPLLHDCWRQVSSWLALGQVLYMY